MTALRNVAIFLFNDVEVLDFAGPFEVFSVTAHRNDPTPFNVYTVAWSKAPLLARGGLSINPHYAVDDYPPPDILLIPGGWGTRPLLKEQPVIDWIKQQAEQVELLLSVCTGSLLLAQAGLLDGLTATTHHGALDLLRTTAPAAAVDANHRFIDNGQIITSGGISAGIDMSLHVVARLLGADVAQATADYMEYRWLPGM